MKKHNNYNPALGNEYFETLFYDGLTKPVEKLFLMAVFGSYVVEWKEFFFVIGLYNNGVILTVAEDDWPSLV